MSIKTLLCVFSGEASELGALEAAFTLTRAHTAVLRILHLADPPILYEAITDYGVAASGLDVLEKDARHLSEAAQAYAADYAARYAIKLHIDGSPDMPPLQARFQTLIGGASDLLPAQSRTADMIVVAGDNRPTGEFEVVFSVLFHAGRPVLVVPHNLERPFASSGHPGTVALAWDGSVAAARAIRDALPLMQHANAVYLLCVEEGAEIPGESSTSDMVAYLHSHSISAERLRLPRNVQNVGAVLLTQAARLGADLLVMGAYGSGHLGEMFLGGATDHVLKHARLPLLLSR
ncbi:universal stress protein [Asticcacaulis sp.]|uniref:universal stress protein n=1 Tax=Asticcacaulis sp. TaxID=1872648 RepID=UPI002C1B1431|nr:universal stress protein [Asticcacaulis sp.]HTM82811.1 universal stress protein [Asticcacaulis sp.]